jgi:protein SCO1/2
MITAGLRYFSALVVSVALFACTHTQKKVRLLPYYGIRHYSDTLKDTVYHQVLPFSMTDQFNQTVTLDSFRNKIFVANFFFVTCPGICRIMNNELELVAKNFAGDGNVKFVSYTVNPEQDTVEALAGYAKLHDAVPYQWYFLRGDRKATAMLAKASYNLETDGYLVHSQNLTLIDKEGHIRGVYSGTVPSEVTRLTADIKKLEEEEKQNGE